MKQSPCELACYAGGDLGPCDQVPAVGSSRTQPNPEHRRWCPTPRPLSAYPASSDDFISVMDDQAFGRLVDIEYKFVGVVVGAERGMGNGEVVWAWGGHAHVHESRSVHNLIMVAPLKVGYPAV